MVPFSMRRKGIDDDDDDDDEFGIYPIELQLYDLSHLKQNFLLVLYTCCLILVGSCSNQLYLIQLSCILLIVFFMFVKNPQV